MMFAIVMGFSGLTIVMQRAEHMLGLSDALSKILVSIDTVLFLVISTLYLAKIIKYFNEVKSEFLHRDSYANLFYFLYDKFLDKQKSRDITLKSCLVYPNCW
jgi:tellurite resistance protein TehA-like permease